MISSLKSLPCNEGFLSTGMLAEIWRFPRTPTSLLFPTLTGLLQPSCPQWLRSPVSTALSLLPLRPGGVRQTIAFLATTISKPMSDSTSEGLVSEADSKPVLSLETLTQASKLLSSVPSSLSPEVYFTRLAPQLLDLLDNGPDDMRRAVAFIVGSGILGRRAYGAPGTIGWKLFAQPIIETLNPTQDGTRISTTNQDRSASDLDSIIMDEVDVQQALNRLAALILSHPNPGLTRWLVGQLRLPLWGLLCYARKTGRNAWLDGPSKLLHTYLGTAANAVGIIKVAEELQWDGGSWWIYGPGRQGGIEIRKRARNPSSFQDIVATVQDVDSRVEEFLNLLGPAITDQQTIGDVFISITKRWLLTGSRAEGRGKSSGAFNDNGTNPMHLLAYAKLAQGMLERYKDKLAGDPDQLFDLVEQLLEDFVESVKRKKKHSRPGTISVSLHDLGTLLDHDEDRPEELAGESDVRTDTVDDRAEIVSVALSLLSAILTSPDFVRTSKSIELYSKMQSPLAYISRSKPSVPSALSIAASNIASLLDLQTSSADPSAVTSDSDPHLNDRKTYSLALTYLSDSVVPVRAQGLSLLTTLITSRSPILDISATSVLLLSLLQDEDEYIYLNTIKSLSLLAQHHPRTVIKMLAERYLDREEDMGLDRRLRIGEALLRTVEGLGKGLFGEIARNVGDATIELAGRRGQRPKAEAQRHAAMRNKQTRIKEAEEAWGGEVPLLGKEVENDLNSERLAKLVEAWEGKDAEEDVRIRTSALSVLGAAIQTNIGGLGSTLTSTAVDMAISILTLELGDETAILRRAAVLLILNVARAVDRAGEEGRNLGFGFAGDNLEDVVRVLQYVEATDRDGLVKEHTGAVIESLEAWRSKTLLGAHSVEGSDSTSIIPPGVGRLAGLSVDPSMPSSTRPRIEEVD